MEHLEHEIVQVLDVLGDFPAAVIHDDGDDLIVYSLRNEDPTNIMNHVKRNRTRPWIKELTEKQKTRLEDKLRNMRRLKN